jgi:WD40 repeat protein
MKRFLTTILLIGTALFSSSMPYLAQEDERNIQIITAENAERIAEKYVFDAEQGPVSGVTYMPLLDVLVSSNYQNTWHGWNLLTGELISSVEGDGALITTITATSLVSNLKIMAYSVIRDGVGVGVILDMDESERQYLIGHEAEITRMELSPSGEYAATSSTDNTTRVWDTSNGEELFVIEDDVPALAIVFSSNNQLLAVSGSKLRVYNVESGERMAEFEGEQSSALAFAEYNDERMLLIAQPGLLNVLNFSNADENLALRLSEDSSSYQIAVSPFEKIVAVGGSDDGDIYIYSFEQEDSGLLTVLEGHTDGITDIRFDFIGNQIASASFDGTVRVWEVAPAE